MIDMNASVPFIVFMDSIKNPITTPKYSKSVASNGVRQIAVEIKGAEQILAIVEGTIADIGPDGEKLSDSECSWSSLAVINSEKYDMTNSMEDNGIYYVGIAGCNRIRVRVIEVTGEVTITATGVE